MASPPRNPAGHGATALPPLAPAEHAHRVVAILGCLEDRLVTESCGAVADRSRPLPMTDLTDLIDRVVWSELRGDPDAVLVAELVTLELARGLPLALRLAGRTRPRWALSVHDGRRGERHRTLDLVRATHRRLGGAPRHPSARGRRPAEH